VKARAKSRTKHSGAKRGGPARARRKLHRLTRRLEIRAFRPGDYKNWREAALAIEPRKKNRWDMKPAPAALTRAKFRQLLKRQARDRKLDRFYDFGVFRRDSGELIGKVAIMAVDRGLAQAAYLGYRIWNTSWGNGFGSEASRAAIDIAFRDLGIHGLEAGIEPGNERSVRLARGLGMKKEGLKLRAVYLRGKWRGLLAYVAFSEDFGIRTPPPKAGRS
jgi:ribosomal-protein-alanine N-acetyltransferase